MSGVRTNYHQPKNQKSKHRGFSNVSSLSQNRIASHSYTDSRGNSNYSNKGRKTSFSSHQNKPTIKQKPNPRKGSPYPKSKSRSTSRVSNYSNQHSNKSYNNQHTNPQERVCRFWKKAACRDGQTCKFPHFEFMEIGKYHNKDLGNPQTKVGEKILVQVITKKYVSAGELQRILTYGEDGALEFQINLAVKNRKAMKEFKKLYIDKCSKDKTLTIEQKIGEKTKLVLGQYSKLQNDQLQKTYEDKKQAEKKKIERNKELNLIKKNKTPPPIIKNKEGKIIAEGTKLKKNTEEKDMRMEEEKALKLNKIKKKDKEIIIPEDDSNELEMSHVLEEMSNDYAFNQLNQNNTQFEDLNQLPTTNQISDEASNQFNQYNKLMGQTRIPGQRADPNKIYNRTKQPDEDEKGKEPKAPPKTQTIQKSQGDTKLVVNKNTKPKDTTVTNLKQPNITTFYRPKEVPASLLYKQLTIDNQNDLGNQNFSVLRNGPISIDLENVTYIYDEECMAKYWKLEKQEESAFMGDKDKFLQSIRLLSTTEKELKKERIMKTFNQCQPQPDFEGPIGWVEVSTRSFNNAIKFFEGEGYLNKLDDAAIKKLELNMFSLVTLPITSLVRQFTSELDKDAAETMSIRGAQNTVQKQLILGAYQAKQLQYAEEQSYTILFEVKSKTNSGKLPFFLRIQSPLAGGL